MLRYLGYVNTAKTHRYHSRFVRDIFGALRRSIRYRSRPNLSWPQRTLPLGCAFPELRCVFGDRAIVPDVVVLTWAQIPLDEDGEIANLIPLAPA